MTPPDLSDDELLEQFEAATLPSGSFHHREHVRAAFLYLSRFPALEALDRFSEALRRFAAVSGKPDRYHETITWAYVFLVRERMADPAQSWEQFAGCHPDLLDWRNSILRKYYTDGTLASDQARRRFVMPDRHMARLS